MKPATAPDRGVTGGEGMVSGLIGLERLAKSNPEEVVGTWLVGVRSGLCTTSPPA